MTTQLTPIKVKIGLRPNGHANHPDWTKLPMINSDSEVRQYAPSGWIYDKSCGHQEDSIDSPRGMQWGCLLVTQEFADEAVVAYPDLITKITEVEFEDFFNNKARKHLAEKNYNMDVLKGLKLELDLKRELGQDVVALKAKIAKALDPNDSEKGIEKNDERYWSDYQIKKGLEIKK